MIKTALAIMIILASFSSIAQTADSASSMNKEFRKTDRHPGKQNFDNLNLTNDQKAQIKTLDKTFRQQMQDLKKDTTLSAGDMKEKHEALAKQHKEKMETILTPDQRQHARDMQQQFGQGKNGEMRGRKYEEMTKDLNLTADQSAKMKELNEALRSNMQSIRQNTAITQDEKKEQMKSLMKKHKDDMEALLTDEQKEQLKNNLKNKRKETV